MIFNQQKGTIAYDDGQIFTVVTKYGASTLAAVYAVVPEPATALFLLLGAATGLGRRFRRV